MSRARLRRALERRDGVEPAVVPSIEAHAARLEQLAEARWAGDAEACARMFRSVQALYGLDAVTIGGGGLLAAAAAVLAATPTLGPAEALAEARAGRPPARRADPAGIAETRIVATAKDVIGRLRPTLGERAGIAVVLPDAGRLARQGGATVDAGWAVDVLAEIVRAIGPDEPDLFLLVGDDEEIDPAIEGSAEFFGVPLLACATGAAAGVAVLDAETLSPPASPARLYVTRGEVPAAADPQVVRAAIERLRAIR